MKDFHFVNDDFIVVDYEYVLYQTPQHSPRAGPGLSLLVDVIHKVRERALYYETDSTIYVEDPSCSDVTWVIISDILQTSVKTSHNTEFISSGPKNYA